MSADASFSYDEQQNHIVNNMMQVSMELCVDDVEGTSDGNGRTTHCDQSAADVSPDDMDTSSSNQEISETEYSRQTQGKEPQLLGPLYNMLLSSHCTVTGL